jgi:hypothetical protein
VRTFESPVEDIELDGPDELAAWVSTWKREPFRWLFTELRNTLQIESAG